MKFSSVTTVLWLMTMTHHGAARLGNAPRSLLNFHELRMNNCNEPGPSDFKIPDFEPVPTLPPFKNHQLFIGLLMATLPAISKYETPIALRFTNLVDTMVWNCVASHHRTYRSALPNHPLVRAPRRSDGLSDTSEARLLCVTHAVASAFPLLFPGEEEGVGSFLAGLSPSIVGLSESDMGLPEDLTEACPCASDKGCLTTYLDCKGYAPWAVGAVVAYQVVEYSHTDGWNDQGQLTKGGRTCTANCRPYQDSTMYDPMDQANLTGCRDILLDDGSNACWEPLVEDFGRGYFTRQEHVTPHIGPNAIPRVLTQQQVQDRKAAPPNYDYAAEIDDVFRRVGNLTDMDKMLIEFGDDKITVAVSILLAMLTQFGPDLLPFEALAFWVIAYTTTENDSLITVWNEKVRQNLIRPTTVAQRLNPTDIVETYVKGMGNDVPIARGDFQPYIRTMPHAEYPSGSACLFQGAVEWTDLFLKMALPPGTYDPDNFPIAMPYAGSSKVEPGITPAEDILLSFSNLGDLCSRGGQSRLDGGMHFGASVPAGMELCSGIGSIVGDWAQSLLVGLPLGDGFGDSMVHANATSSNTTEVFEEATVSRATDGSAGP